MSEITPASTSTKKTPKAILKKPTTTTTKRPAKSPAACKKPKKEARISTEHEHVQKKLYAVTSELSIDVTDDVSIFIKKNKNFTGGVEIRLGGPLRGRFTYDTWTTICKALDIVQSAKDFILGTVGKEEKGNDTTKETQSTSKEPEVISQQTQETLNEVLESLLFDDLAKEN